MCATVRKTTNTDDIQYVTIIYICILHITLYNKGIRIKFVYCTDTHSAAAAVVYTSFTSFLYFLLFIF